MRLLIAGAFALYVIVTVWTLSVVWAAWGLAPPTDAVVILTVALGGTLPAVGWVAREVLRA